MRSDFTAGWTGAADVDETTVGWVWWVCSCISAIGESWMSHRMLRVGTAAPFRAVSGGQHTCDPLETAGSRDGQRDSHLIDVRVSADRDQPGGAGSAAPFRSDGSEGDGRPGRHA